MPVRVLTIDDDKHVTELIGRYGADEGYDVQTAHTIAEGIDRAKSSPPDVVLLDLRLPDAAGLEGFKRVRAVTAAPVIMLTACDEELQRILGLEIGADDYVTKPFSPREVMARIRTVLRRVGGRDAGANSKARVEIGVLTIDREAHEVRVADREVALTPTEYAILDLLASRPGKTFARSELLDALRTDADIYDRTLDKHMTNLRRKLEVANDYIQTVYGVGYKLRKDATTSAKDRVSIGLET